MAGRTRSVVARVLLSAILLASTGCGLDHPSGRSEGGSTGREIGKWDPVRVEGVASCAVLARMVDDDAARPDEGLESIRLPCLTRGPDVDLAQLRGRPVLVNIWASWCGPCRTEMPVLTAAHERFGDQVQFVGLNTADNPPGAVEFLDEFDVRYPQVADVNNVLLDRLRIPGLPVTLVVGADGSILERHIGAFEEPELDQLLSELTSR